MIRNSICTIIFLSLVLLHPHNGYCAKQTPEQFVSEFYQWYFKANSGKELADRNDEIYKYVAKQTVDDIRRKVDNTDIYYFTKVNSYSWNWKNVRSIIHPARAIGNKLYVTHVTFDTGYNKNDVIVSLTKEDGKFYIRSVEDVYPDILE